jgi:hypothetical protein
MIGAVLEIASHILPCVSSKKLDSAKPTPEASTPVKASRPSHDLCTPNGSINTSVKTIAPPTGPAVDWALGKQKVKKPYLPYLMPEPPTDRTLIASLDDPRIYASTQSKESVLAYIAEHNDEIAGDDLYGAKVRRNIQKYGTKVQTSWNAADNEEAISDEEGLWGYNTIEFGERGKRGHSIAYVYTGKFQFGRPKTVAQCAFARDVYVDHALDIWIERMNCPLGPEQVARMAAKEAMFFEKDISEVHVEYCGAYGAEWLSYESEVAQEVRERREDQSLWFNC